MNRLTPDMLLRAYAYGIFPMAEGRSDPAVHWIEPEQRGIIPLDSFHVPKRLRRTVRQGVYDVRFPGLGALAAATHNIQVSPYSSGVVTCVPTTTGTATAGADLLVRVECFSRYSFAPTNAYFTILVIE